ncbi:MAG: DUF4381 domain-containing protein [Nitrosomonas sp.]|nr:DUF4381 domain-containing protein [Nitrosomonas sp.]
MPDPLDALRPLHAPASVSWWPPAIGWWILAAVIIALLVLLYRHRRRMAPQRAALRELKLLEKQIKSEPQLVATLNALLKRYALVCWPSSTVASLTGKQWLEFLDAHGGNGQFSQGCGRLLATSPYRGEPLPLDELLSLARRWIKKNRPKKNV